MRRRDFLAGGASATALAMVPVLARASVPSLGGNRVPAAYNWAAIPPMDSRQAYIDWMAKNRGEEPLYLGERFDRFQQMI